jgi:hypothetical protein
MKRCMDEEIMAQQSLVDPKERSAVSIADTKENDVDTFRIRHILELKFLKKNFVWENGTGSRNLAGGLSHIDAQIPLRFLRSGAKLKAGIRGGDELGGNRRPQGAPTFYRPKTEL